MSMLLKALFLLIILYYVIRASRALLRAIRQDGGRPLREELHQDRHRTNGWQGRSSPNAGREADVEDAKWIDL